MSMEPNTLYYGDCLDWMRQWEDACVDLIYLDPPFNSNTDYNILYSATGGGQAQYRAFQDTWRWDEAAADRYGMYANAVGRPAHWAIVGLHGVLGDSGIMAYLTYMAERLEEMRRLLKPTGSVFLHCDPVASHSLKLLMDAVFGQENFRNEVVWQRTLAKSLTRRQLPSNHDIILSYQKGPSANWNMDSAFVPYDRNALDARTASKYNHRDSAGRLYRLDSLINPNPNRPNLTYEFLGVTRVWRWTKERMQAAYDEGLVIQTRPGAVPQLKRYLDEQRGRPLGDIWNDIPPLNSQAKERLGYPTQKPLALLDRIISLSSNPEDIVLDPFCGCGTAIEAAHRLNRRWVGIDISSFAIDLTIEKRLKDKTTPTRGIPFDLESARKLATEQPFSFETWAVTRIPGFAPNTRQMADGGVDGRATLADRPDADDSLLALAQVKGGRFSLSALRDFIGVVDRDKAALGCYITLDPVTSAEARAAVANAGTVRVAGYDYRRVQLWSIDEYFQGRLPQMPIMTDPYTGKRLLGNRLF